jgi:predicted ArsR family transcriptional regulator
MPETSEGERALLQRRARALGDPTRFQIFRCIVESPEPLRVAAITRKLGLNHNAIRQHLAKLREAGLVHEERVPGNGPGRPPLQYRLATEAAGTWGTPSPYEELARLLLDLHKSGRSPREVAAEAGRGMVFERSSNGSLEHLEIEMARRGFQPRRVDEDDEVELVFERCPYEALATTDPDVICELHLGLAEGIVEAAAGEVEVAQLVARDPEHAGCGLRLRFTGVAPEAAGE